MFSSTEPIMSREMDKLSSFLFSTNGSSSFKISEQGNNEAEYLRNKEMMGSQYFHHNSQFQQQQQNNGGLTRYRSAPSSFFAGFLDENLVTHEGSSSSDSESMFTALLNNNDNNSMNNGQKNELQFASSSMKKETAEEYGNSVQNGYESGGMGSAYGVGEQMQSRSVGLSSNENNGGSNLIRQSSSPAGFFNRYDVMREVGNIRASTGANRDASSSANGFSNHISYSSAQSSSSNFMPSIAENESWNDSSFNSLKRNRDGDLKMFSNNLTSQNGESRNYTSGSGLTHHLSLPKTSSEMAAIEKYLQFQQDSVPCKIRAKRGCATHPRSIAERMRRTRISERMKKLQELFPNMDKQTNTADMLDLAVDYIKDLQKQVQTLTDKKAKCINSCNIQMEHHKPGFCTDSDR